MSFMSLVSILRDCLRKGRNSLSLDLRSPKLVAFKLAIDASQRIRASENSISRILSARIPIRCH